MNIKKPDSTIVQTKLGWDFCENDFYDAKVDNVVMRLWSATEYATVGYANIYFWDFSEYSKIKEKVKRSLPDKMQSFLR